MKKRLLLIALLLCCGMDVPTDTILTKATKRVYREGYMDGMKAALEAIKDSKPTLTADEIESNIDHGWTNMWTRFK